MTPKAPAICRAEYFRSSKNCASVSLMSSGVSFMPRGTGMIRPVFLTPLPKSSKASRKASFASWDIVPVYSRVAFAVMPCSYSLFM